MASDGVPLEDVLLARPAQRAPVGGVAKRIFDVIVSLGLIVFLAPLFVLIAITIKLSYPGPIFFKQPRVGHQGRRFGCFKFRSMVVNSAEVLADLLANDEDARREWEASQKLRNDPRITVVGKILRESSLDELPQLFNVLRGQMSLVGPRPIVDDEIRRYGKNFVDYASARPGITGLWQVSGRSNCTYARRVGFDATYVREWSLAGDISILFRTVRVVLKSEGSC